MCTIEIAFGEKVKLFTFSPWRCRALRTQRTTTLLAELLLLDRLHNMRGLALRGDFGRGEAARRCAAADLERFRFHFQNSHFCVELRGALAAPLDLLGWVAYSGIRIGHARSPNAFA